MATSWLEITDTAIKIGLGALIAGVFSIFLIFATAYRDSLVDRRSRQMKHIEDVLGRAERYLNHLIKHASVTAWHYSTDLDPAAAKQAKRDYEGSNSRSDEAADDLNTATSRLMLMGFEAIAAQLREASDVADQLFQEMEAGGRYDEQMTKFRNFRRELSERRLQIMRMLRKAYWA
jgi:hypothetical protein